MGNNFMLDVQNTQQLTQNLKGISSKLQPILSIVHKILHTRYFLKLYNSNTQTRSKF